MDAISLLAAVASTVAMICLGLRANMLKPDMASWPDSPRCVRWASFFLSVVFGGYASVLWFAGHKAPTEGAGLATAVAVYSVFLWINIVRQSKRPDEEG